MNESSCKKRCCTVKWCPLVTSWATTIHKFQGFEAGFDATDMFRYLIVDPGDLTWEQMCPGALYVALSRAKTMGTFASDTNFPRGSAIYWKGDGITTMRITEGSLKYGKRRGDPKVKCELILKRQSWVTYLHQKQNATNTREYSKSELHDMDNKRFSQAKLQNCIAQMITDPNDTWLQLKREKYLTPKTYFGTYA